MNEASGEGKRPGRPPSLTREDIARAALEAGRERGMEAVSVLAAARVLGVSHSTLYGYVRDRGEVVFAAVELATSEFEWPPADQDWRPLLTAFAEALWTFLNRYPGMAEVLYALPNAPKPFVRVLVGYGTALRAAGFSPRDALVAVDMIVDLTLCSDIAMRGLDRVHQTADGPRRLRELLTRVWAELDDSVLEEAAWSGRGRFDDKLAVILDGFAARVRR
ncbi:TetR/AcrR family transcriptional regulator [Pseudonocardia acaciae]|uniref:TetR/AcrR family transcriptional regulator n=1 Tax=Pseudonocardia acaciae TaxID=551276 RepID=UPI00048F44ED|nr:TetR/AcrR family transcriptional regulator C-terminal domain-containing protein [Pseudonocardia acaciae]